MERSVPLTQAEIEALPVGCHRLDVTITITTPEGSRTLFEGPTTVLIDRLSTSELHLRAVQPRDDPAFTTERAAIGRHFILPRNLRPDGTLHGMGIEPQSWVTLTLRPLEAQR